MPLKNFEFQNGLTLEIAWSKPKPRAHPYLPAVPNTHYTLPGLLTPLIDAPPVPLIRQPDLVAPTVVSQELLTSKSSIMNYFQVILVKQFLFSQKIISRHKTKENTSYVFSSHRKQLERNIVVRCCLKQPLLHLCKLSLF